jgi:hypothetical protein
MTAGHECCGYASGFSASAVDEDGYFFATFSLNSASALA